MEINHRPQRNHQPDVQIPIAQGVEHNIQLWYAYTNEDPISIENQTILTSLEPPEYKPGRESTGTLLRPFLLVIVFAVAILLLFLYSRRRKTHKKTYDCK